jgi:AraC-like DNA-binding protein
MDNLTRSQVAIAEGFIGQKMVVLPPDRRRKITRNALARCLYPAAIGYYPRASYHDRARDHGSEQYILLYCVDGRGWVRVGDKEYLLVPNTFFIIPRHVPHHYGSSGQDAWSIYWVHFSGDHAPLMYSRYEAGGGGVKVIPFSEERVHLFENLILSLEHDAGIASLEAAYISLVQLIGSFIYLATEKGGSESDRISASIGYMKENLHKAILITELASLSNYSVSRYSELFKQRTGFSPIHYLIQLRIQRSCQYLYFTTMNIKEICKETGFEDPYYFSRMFRKQIGVSPVVYRKGQRG